MYLCNYYSLLRWEEKGNLCSRLLGKKPNLILLFYIVPQNTENSIFYFFLFQMNSCSFLSCYYKTCIILVIQNFSFIPVAPVYPSPKGL